MGDLLDEVRVVGVDLEVYLAQGQLFLDGLTGQLADQPALTVTRCHHVTSQSNDLVFDWQRVGSAED